MLRVEGRVERDDWRFPDLDALVRAAGSSYVEGRPEEAVARRKEAILRAWNSPDLTPADRKRVAALVAAEIDEAKSLGVVAAPEHTLAEIAPAKLLAADAPELDAVTLDELLGV